MRSRKLTRFAAVTVLLLISAACGPNGPQLPNVPPSATPAPTATNTPSAAGLCANNLVPVKLGATWTYTNNSGTADAEQFTATIVGIRPDGFTVELSSQGTPAINQEWSCKPEGLLASALGSGQNALGLSVAGIQANLTTSNATGILLPANVQQGTQWTYGLDLSGRLSQGNLAADLTGNIATAMQATGTESVTVPAGTFDAMKVQGTSTFKIMAGYQGISIPVTSVVNLTFWFAPGVGWIKATESGELVGTAFSNTTELQSYTIP